MTALSLMKGKKLVVPSVVIVLLMAISRNYLMAHYPSDVLVAAIIGVASGFIAWVITRFIFRFLEDRRDSMPIAELVLDFDIREVLPFDIPFIGAAPEKAPAPAKKAPLTPETIRKGGKCVAPALQAQSALNAGRLQGQARKEISLNVRTGRSRCPVQILYKCKLRAYPVPKY